MQITTQVKLLPTSEQTILLKNTMQEYINTANNTVSQFVLGGNTLKQTQSGKAFLRKAPGARQKINKV